LIQGCSYDAASSSSSRSNGGTRTARLRNSRKTERLLSRG
jgi:hypothetical protein